MLPYLPSVTSEYKLSRARLHFPAAGFLGKKNEEEPLRKLALQLIGSAC